MFERKSGACVTQELLLKEIKFDSHQRVRYVLQLVGETKDYSYLVYV